MKNSSRLLLAMARNFSRSSAGTCGSHASSRTRSLKASQDSSRLMNHRESERDWIGATGSGGGTTESAAGSAGPGCPEAAGMPASDDVGAPSISGPYMRTPTVASDKLDTAPHRVRDCRSRGASREARDVYVGADEASVRNGPGEGDG